MKEFITRERDNCGFGLIANTKSTSSHLLLQRAISSLERMIHRGAIAADGKSADGSGMLLSIPDTFMRKVVQKEGFELPTKYAVGVIFSKDDSFLEKLKEIAAHNGIAYLGKREVPLDTNALGEFAKTTLPKMTQVFFDGHKIAGIRFEPMLYLTRKELEKHYEADEDFYISSFSSKSISYKGLIMPTHIKEFFLDFQDEDFEISFALFHQRFSTNTVSKWRLAQPFRMIAHNGEINSIQANRFNVAVKSEFIESNIFSAEEIERVLPIIQPVGSDSASLDNYFEFLTLNGIDFLKAVRMVMPYPWQNMSHLSDGLQSFYEYTSTFSEAWDGPAAVSFSNGQYIGCVVDRNGLRPAKYTLYDDNTFIIASEHGVLDIAEEHILKRGKLQSGEMIALDLDARKILFNKDIDAYIDNHSNYRKWLAKYTQHFEENVGERFYGIDQYKLQDLEQKQKFFNITIEAIDQVIVPSCETGKENVGSMGDDTPMAVFSKEQRSFFDFFRQKFAQVTNPAIDPYRERIVMSLNTSYGVMGNIFMEGKEHTYKLKSASPLLRADKLDLFLKYSTDENHPLYSTIKSKIFSTTYQSDLKQSLDNLIETILNDVKNKQIRTIILDDRAISKDNKVIPMAMVIGRLNYALLDNKLRSQTYMIAISGEVIDSHGLCVLLSLGVEAIYPYMIYSTIANYYAHLSEAELKGKLRNAYKSLKEGILKIMSKMGISTIRSYRNSALHDIIGISGEVGTDCFRSFDILLKGLTYADIDERISKAHTDAFSVKTSVYGLSIGGLYNYVHKQEYHDFSPDVIYAMQKTAQSGLKKDYNEVKRLIENRDKKFTRDFFTLDSGKNSIEVGEVESTQDICARFSSAAMSLGAISPEAHEVLAEAMNQIGGKSNSGEGGEDSVRFGTSKNSKIKQVASGRFGVTPEYLASAEEIQIKLAQGAKPGEGGQLPGKKVSKLIAKLRFTNPGVTLISPPPHHDIYSIEDLSQLIFDLKQVNPRARIAVKLVSSLGVGIIAVGVAKAYADKIIISGNDGGTGAAPLTSIKYAGNPFELGLIEAHQALKHNHLREYVTLETDGGLKTGLDVVKAAIMGAENFAFGTPALVLTGCKFLRVCHLNKCTVGVATQDDGLREHFTGNVQKVVNYFTLLAEDVRDILASLGHTKLEDIIGKMELLKVLEDKDGIASKIDFKPLLETVDGVDTCQRPFNNPIDRNVFEQEIIGYLEDFIENGKEDTKTLPLQIKNINRSFGARLSGHIAKKYGNNGFKKQIILNINGYAGQSFGAFLINGITLNLAGCANDYVGKGMNGGNIVICSQVGGKEVNLVGNTCLYGATGGKLFVRGTAGERFGIRNSGAVAVTEGLGDHGCEYMTSGAVVVLGSIGVNFGAGMTGGAAFIYDEKGEIVDKVNRELVEYMRINIDDLSMERFYLKKLLRLYYEATDSYIAGEILENFREKMKYFWLVKPKDILQAQLNFHDIN